VTITVRSPGKLILLGEYAVLDGAPALVVAVDRHATCRIEPDREVVIEAGAHGRIEWPSTGADLPLVRGALEAIEPTAGRYHLDSDALYADMPIGRRKLGLGSSAASTVALAGALTVAAGDALDDVTQRRIYQIAQGVHRAVQGTGSGADIAASSLGGALAYRWLDDPSMAPLDGMKAAAGAGHARRLTGHRDRVRAVWSGDQASTVKLVGAIHRWRDRDPAGYRARLADLGFASRAGIDAWLVDDAMGLFAAAEAGRMAIGALGRDAGVDLYTETHARLHAIARAVGAGVKPTGAGGGDLAWVYGPDAESEAAAAKALAAEGHVVFDFAIETRGVHRAG